MFIYSINKKLRCLAEFLLYLFNPATAAFVLTNVIKITPHTLNVFIVFKFGASFAILNAVFNARFKHIVYKYYGNALALEFRLDCNQEHFKRIVFTL